MAQISITIITKNEAQNIRRCLESVKWADEIIIVDSGSTDDTITIAKEYTDKVYITDWPGFGPQKNRALDYATKPWVLSLDADEEITPELAKEIQSTINRETEYSAYEIPRYLVFLDKIIKYASGSSKHLRLFKRTECRFQDVMVHEDLIVKGKSATLKAAMYHYSFPDIQTILQKMNQYTSLVAKQRLERGKKASLLKAFIHALWMFIRVYFIKGGFLDGGPGLILAVSFAEGAFYRYAKMCYPEKK